MKCKVTLNHSILNQFICILESILTQELKLPFHNKNIGIMSHPLINKLYGFLSPIWESLKPRMRSTLWGMYAESAHKLTFLLLNPLEQDSNKFNFKAFLNSNTHIKQAAQKQVFIQSVRVEETALPFTILRMTKFINLEKWLFMIWEENGTDIVLIKP